MAKASNTNSALREDIGENGQNILNAIALLEQATRLDPTFALAYCEIAGADDCLYAQRVDATPTRRMHGDAAVKEALRLQPNLPEAHLAAARHLYDWYRDYQKVRAHLAIAERSLPNSAEVLRLAGYIDRGQGRWAESTKAFERACNLDPENPLDHGRSQKIRDEARKCPRSSSAWTLCENRRPLLATGGLPANLYAQRPDAGDQKLGHENCSCG
jgi:tetratricopeptide (TPR) repeat protein